MNSSRDDSLRRTLVLATALLAMAGAIYRPDRLRPFYVVDFSEFVPLLLGADGFLDRLRSVFEYYANQGRFNAIPYAVLAVKWQLFEGWSPGWQVSRAIVMVLLFVLTYLLLRRVGASRLGALTGGSVYLWAPSAADGWVHLTMGEPLGAAIMLALALRATRFQSATRWKRDVGLMAIGTVALIWTKELMAPLLLLPLALALTVQKDGEFAPPRRSERNVAFVTAVAAASLLAFAPVLFLYLTAGESAYASMYGVAPQPFSRLLGFWIAGLAPFDLVSRPLSVAWALALLGFTTLIAFGWPAGFRSAEHGRRARWLLAIALMVPLVGVLAYLPNPWFARFYSLPYLIGPAILTGMAVTWLQGSRRNGTALAIGTSVAFAGQAAIAATTLAARTDAIQRRDERLIAVVADSIEADTVLYATPHPPPYEWLGMGSSLSRFARATGHPWPQLRYLDCDSARRSTEGPKGVVTLDMDSACGLQGSTDLVVAVPFRRLDPSRLRTVVDSASAKIVLPPANSRNR